MLLYSVKDFLLNIFLNSQSSFNFDIYQVKRTKRNKILSLILCHFLYSIFSKATGCVLFGEHLFLQYTFHQMLLSFGCSFHIGKAECLKKRTFVGTQKDIYRGALGIKGEDLKDGLKNQLFFSLIFSFFFLFNSLKFFF